MIHSPDSLPPDEALGSSAPPMRSLEPDPQGMSNAELAKCLLVDVMRFRRMAAHEAPCTPEDCQACQAPHLPKVAAALAQGKPLTFVLPAFPGKSPNTAKVFGPLPDMAERCALEHLQSLCDRIKRTYPPGAHMILCSDGRVFNDVVGMRDQDITAYQHEISRLIEGLGLTSLSTFNLEDLYASTDYEGLRRHLIEQYGESLDVLQASVRRGKSPDASIEDRESNRLYRGITRFLVEDALHPGQTQSRTRIQKECRTRAYVVIQRSKAWGELIAQKFPDAIRLSIHPQGCGSKKLGIRLMEPDNWQTPWHGVAVQVGPRFVLLKRAQAEGLGAHLASRFGRPSHFVMPDRRLDLFEHKELAHEG